MSIIAKRGRGLARNRPLHARRLAEAVIRNRRRVVQRIGRRQQIAIRVVGKGGDVVEGVGDLRDVVEGRLVLEARDVPGRIGNGGSVTVAIICIARLPPKRVGRSQQLIRPRGTGLGCRLALSICSADGVGTSVEPRRRRVALRVRYRGLRHRVRHHRVSKRPHPTVRQCLFQDPPCAVILIRQV